GGQRRTAGRFDHRGSGPPARPGRGQHRHRDHQGLRRHSLRRLALGRAVPGLASTVAGACHDRAMADAPGADKPDAEKQALLHFLEYQRASVLSIVKGLDEEWWHQSVVPSGWTAAGMVQHLGDAERHWFQRVTTGSEAELPWDEGRPPYDPEAAFVCDR